MHDDIFNQAVNADAISFVDFMRRHAQLSGSVREPDSASSMFRLFTQENWDLGSLP